MWHTKEGFVCFIGYDTLSKDNCHTFRLDRGEQYRLGGTFEIEELPEHLVLVYPTDYFLRKVEPQAVAKAKAQEYSDTGRWALAPQAKFAEYYEREQ